MAHGDIPSSLERLRRVRAIAPDIAIMIDIPGPKIRAGSFGTTPVILGIGSVVELLEGFGEISTAERIYVEREGVLELLRTGDRVHIGDGGVSLVVDEVGPTVKSHVISAGPVMGKPGLSLPSSILNDALPTPDDRDRIEAIRDEDFDILAVSFVRSSQDMVNVREALGRPDIMLMAKIETPEGIENLNQIVDASDSIMVARGDMGVRLPIEEVPHMQKLIVRHGIRGGRPVVVATQMLESMTHAQVPTRAEVTDVANAVLDGASCVMLSGETAIGDDPIATVMTMDRIVRRAETSFNNAQWGESLELRNFAHDSQAHRITAAISGAAWRAALEEDAVAIVACTRTGWTARAISRFRPPMPIVAISPSLLTARQLRTSWGIDHVVVDPAQDIDTLCDVAVNDLVKRGIARSGDNVVVMAGSEYRGAAVTDTVRFVVVP
jgi:pyruvate kinase